MGQVHCTVGSKSSIGRLDRARCTASVAASQAQSVCKEIPSTARESTFWRWGGKRVWSGSRSGSRKGAWSQAAKTTESNKADGGGRSTHRDASSEHQRDASRVDGPGSNPTGGGGSGCCCPADANPASASAGGSAVTAGQRWFFWERNVVARCCCPGPRSGACRPASRGAASRGSLHHAGRAASTSVELKHAGSRP